MAKKKTESSAGTRPAKKKATKKATRKKAATKKSTAKKSTTKKATAQKSTAKKASKKAPRDSNPTVDLFILCDKVTKDRQTGKHTLAGIFDKVTAARFPATIPQFATYAKISGGIGAHQITFQVLGPDKTPLENTKFNKVDIECAEGRKTEITVNIAKLQFPAPGVYNFALKSGDKVLGNPVELNVAEA